MPYEEDQVTGIIAEICEDKLSQILANPSLYSNEEKYLFEKLESISKKLYRITSNEYVEHAKNCFSIAITSGSLSLDVNTLVDWVQNIKLITEKKQPDSVVSELVGYFEKDITWQAKSAKAAMVL